MATIQPGFVIDGRYIIQDVIGSGGTAHVYRAVDKRTNKLCAIKVLKDDYSTDAEFLRRFNSEARAVLNLSHENIVRLIDVGIFNGTNYIVLEYIEGKTLKEYIVKNGALNEALVIKIALQLCDALTHAHESNIIHRDIKPQNVLLKANKMPKLADFGIAKFGSDATQTFQGSRVMGSVQYIAPEQVQGLKDVDHQCDIYSLGIVLYEMATGKVPFDAEESVAIAVMHIHSEMIPPKIMNPHISVALNSIILKATSKEKIQRYASTKDLKRDLIAAIKKPNVEIAKNLPLMKSGRLYMPGGSLANPVVFRKSIFMLVCIITAIGLFAALFLIGRALVESTTKGEFAYIPMLVGKSEAESEDAAARMGFRLVVRSRVTNEEVSEGKVFNQEPKSGNRARQGDNVYVDISAGSPVIEMPLVEGLNIDQAKALLDEWGLYVDGVFSEYSELPNGTVLRQVPEAGVFVEVGEGAEVWISGDNSERETVPSIINNSLTNALSATYGAGFTNILVRLAPTAEGVASSVVINQVPSGGEYVAPETTIQIWVTPSLTYPFTADSAVNIDVPVNDSKVMVVYRNTTADYVLYEDILPAGSRTLPITINSDSPNDKLIITYINGEEVRRDTIKVSPKQ